ncbi:MAG: (deoxy)nucleoside triphosphate pyrophosphohydrolase [Spirochaetales bacterium]|nr:(deoxy)nucleoside triphosphate pyrophosphohydrolase [Spirochaetales bacterium]
MPISTAGVVERNGTYLLAQRKPGTSIGESWEFPGGKVEPGETPEEALEREYLEEFQVSVKVGRRLCMGTFSNRGTEYTLMAYAVELIDDDFVLTEHQRIRWFRLGDLSSRPLARSDRIILDYLLSEA